MFLKKTTARRLSRICRIYKKMTKFTISKQKGWRKLPNWILRAYSRFKKIKRIKFRLEYLSAKKRLVKNKINNKLSNRIKNSVKKRPNKLSNRIKNSVKKRPNKFKLSAKLLIKKFRAYVNR